MSWGMSDMPISILSSELVNHLGTAYATVDSWVRQGLIERENYPGHGNPRNWDSEDSCAIAMVKAVMDSLQSTRAAKEAARIMRNYLAQEDGMSMLFIFKENGKYSMSRGKPEIKYEDVAPWVAVTSLNLWAVKDSVEKYFWRVKSSR